MAQKCKACGRANNYASAVMTHHADVVYVQNSYSGSNPSHRRKQDTIASLERPRNFDKARIDLLVEQVSRLEVELYVIRKPLLTLVEHETQRPRGYIDPILHMDRSISSGGASPSPSPLPVERDNRPAPTTRVSPTPQEIRLAERVRASIKEIQGDSRQSPNEALKHE